MVCYQNYRRSKETFFISQWSWTFLFNDSRYLCFEFDQNKRQTYIYVSMFLLSTISRFLLNQKILCQITPLTLKILTLATPREPPCKTHRQFQLHFLAFIAFWKKKKKKMPRRERKTDSIWRVPGMSILLSPGVSDPTKALCVHLYTRWRARAHALCVSMCAAVCVVCPLSFDRYVMHRYFITWLLVLVYLFRTFDHRIFRLVTSSRNLERKSL